MKNEIEILKIIREYIKSNEDEGELILVIANCNSSKKSIKTKVITEVPNPEDLIAILDISLNNIKEDVISWN